MIASMLRGNHMRRTEAKDDLLLGSTLCGIFATKQVVMLQNERGF